MEKSTAPNSASVSIATRDKPATIAGRAAGKIIEYKVLNFENLSFFLNQLNFVIYKKDALAKIYTYAYKEKEIERITPNNPSNFGMFHCNCFKINFLK